MSAFDSDDTGDWPEQYHDDPGCIECDWGERPCHCMSVEDRRAAMIARTQPLPGAE